MKLGSVIVGAILVTGIASCIGVSQLSKHPTPLLAEAVRQREGDAMEIGSNDFVLMGRHMNAKSDVLAFGGLYRDCIMEMGKKYSIPPEMILATFKPELDAQNAFTKITDDILTYVPGWNPSIGLAQMRIGTAMDLLTRNGRDMKRDEVVKWLKTPEGAIEAVAMYYRWVIDTTGRGDPVQIMQDPYEMSMLYATYVGGRKPDRMARVTGTAVCNMFEETNLYDLFGTLDEKTVYCVQPNHLNFNKGIRGITEYKASESGSSFPSLDILPTDEEITKMGEYARIARKMCLDSKKDSASPEKPRNAPQRKMRVN